MSKKLRPKVISTSGRHDRVANANRRGRSAILLSDYKFTLEYLRKLLGDVAWCLGKDDLSEHVDLYFNRVEPGEVLSSELSEAFELFSDSWDLIAAELSSRKPH